MAMPASFSFFFLSLIIICCSGFIVGFSFRESLIPGGAMSFLKQSKIGIKRRSLGDTSTTIITVPSSNNPVSVSPMNPSATPITVPSTNSPVPAVAYPPPSSSQPPPSTPASATTGQRWCVAKTGASQSALQSALDYACGMGGADCSQIQQAGRCYNPNTLQNHASYAFNSYYQKNPIPTSCDFGGTATLVNTNPSSGSCIYPSSSSSSSTPTPSSPTTSTPTPVTSTSPTPTPTPTSSSTTTTTTPSPTSSATTTTPSSPGAFGYGSPPSALNSTSSSPGLGFTPISGLPSPPSASTTSWSLSATLRPSLRYIILLISLVTAKLSIVPRLLL